MKNRSRKGLLRNQKVSGTDNKESGFENLTLAGHTESKRTIGIREIYPTSFIMDSRT